MRRRRFFEDRTLERELLARVGDAITKAGLWDELKTDWMVLDCELMPWSVKAQQLLRTQYAPVGAAASASRRGPGWRDASCRHTGSTAGGSWGSTT